ncbi:MAG: hypothetical protein ACTSX6_03330 [Candidatus Heimdallarchaeaceae archaeon]
MVLPGWFAWLFIILILFGAIASIGIVFLSITPQKGGDETTVRKYSYAGLNVKHTLDSSNIYTGSAVNPTYYIYDKKPEDWGNCRVDPADGYIDTGTASSGTYTVMEHPGTYYVRADLSNYYCEFFTITLPSSGDVPLSDYNDEPATTKVKLMQADTISISNVDLGITTNETSDITYTKVATDTIADNYGYRLDEIKLQEDATYSFATDSDGDGIYDEGINEIEITISSGTFSKKWVPFKVSASIDEFSGDDEARLDIDDGDKEYLEIPEEKTLTITFQVTCDQTLSATGDGDEKCGNGEDFIDSVILVDAEGNTATFDLVG